MLGPDVQLVHSVWLDDGEIDLIAASGAVVVHCPVSNMYLASGVARVPEMRRRGIPVALATDGPGSNNSQDMLETLKAACLLQKVANLDAMALLPEDAVWMACRGGAAAFGQPALIGSLEAGKKADVVLVDLNTPFAMPVHKPVSALVYNAGYGSVDTVIVDGKLLMRGKKVLCVDEEALLAEARQVCARLFERGRCLGRLLTSFFNKEIIETMNTRLYQKDFITTPDWTVEDLNTMIDLAFKLKGDSATGVLHDHILRAKTLYMLFFEESTRTRNSFETGMTQLGGHAIWLTPKATQIGHGENAKDTGMVLSSYGNGIAIRDCRTGIGNKYLYEMAQYADAPIINMQDDVDHPCQAMADLFTLMELFGRDLRGRKFVVSWTYAPKYVRPLSVPQSLVWLMPRFGMDVTVAYPKGYHMMPEVMEKARQFADEAGTKLVETNDMDEAFKDADFLYPKSWGPIMVTEDEPEVEAMAAQNTGWRVTQEKMALAKKHAVYMHCMPIDRGHEADGDVIDGPQSIIYKQAENRLHIQKALMALTMTARA